MGCLVAVTALLCGATLTECSPSELQITTQPGLFPAFSPIGHRLCEPL